ncbi:MAG TPA: response regulator [Pyrinomonadaceae bacterium]|jgi:DNA-binding response OmpR family regulator
MDSQFSKQILCVDDDSDTCELIEMFFAQSGLKIVTVKSIAETKKLIGKESFSLYILDSKLNDGNSSELIERIRETDKTTPIVVYSGDAQKAHIASSLADGVNEYVVKPNWDELVETVKNLLAKTSYSDLKSSKSYGVIQNNNQNQI